MRLPVEACDQATQAETFCRKFSRMSRSSWAGSNIEHNDTKFVDGRVTETGQNIFAVDGLFQQIGDRTVSERSLNRHEGREFTAFMASS